jgi:hypothetical protein
MSGLGRDAHGAQVRYSVAERFSQELLAPSDNRRVVPGKFLE